jgi:hypothetical protein
MSINCSSPLAHTSVAIAENGVDIAVAFSGEGVEGAAIKTREESGGRRARLRVSRRRSGI